MDNKGLSQLDSCAVCGGTLEVGKTSFTADLGSGVLVVRDVPTHICIRCGAEWLDHAVNLQIDQYADEVRTSGEKVGIFSYDQSRFMAEPV